MLNGSVSACMRACFLSQLRHGRRRLFQHRERQVSPPIAAIQVDFLFCAGENVVAVTEGVQCAAVGGSVPHAVPTTHVGRRRWRLRLRVCVHARVRGRSHAIIGGGNGNQAS